MKRWRTIVAITIALLLAGGGFVTWKVWPRKRVTVTDARRIRTPEPNARVRDILWDVPESAEDLLRLTDGATDYAMDADGRRLVYRRGDGAAADLFVREKAGERWSPPAPLDAVNSPDAELDVSLSPDGGTLVFASDRAGATGGFDLYISRYSSGAWGAPAPISVAESAYDERGAAVSRHGVRVFFASNRPRMSRPGDGAESTSQPNAPAGDFNLYCVDLLASAPPVAIDVANSVADELGGALSPADDFLYFASNRDDGAGGYDLYRIRLLPDAYGAVERLDDTINTPEDERAPILGLSGFRLTYCSGDGDAAKLLRSTSREVYRDVTFERGVIDWAALWRQIAPNLMWALLALILTLLFLAMMRDFRDRRLSLMARCLLASLLAHLVLMLLFNVLKVSTTIASAIGRQDRIRVSLMSEASAGEIGEQIRGEFVAVDTVETEIADAERPALDSPSVEAMASVEVAPKSVEAPDDAPSDTALLRIETSDSQLVPAAPSATMSDTAPDLSELFASEASDDVALPEAAPAESRSEAPVPAGVALVGDTELESFEAPLQTPTSQPAGHLMDIGVGALVDAPMDGETALSAIEPTDAAPDGVSNAVDAPSLADAVAFETLARPLALGEVSLPGETSATSDRDEVGVQVAGVNVDAPKRAALAINERDAGGALVELAIANDSGAPTDAAPTSSAIEADDVSMDNVFAAAPTDAPAPDDPGAPALTLAIALPGDLPKAADATTSPDESVDIVSPKVALSETKLPSANEALAASQSGSVTLATLSPASDTSWVWRDARRANGDIRADDASDAGAPSSPSTEEGVEAPIVRVALGVGIPVAPPQRPAGVRRGMIGRIVGTVEDAERGAGLPGARILLALPDDNSIVAFTDENGSYEIQVPPVPDHFALSASRGGYTPESLNVDASRVRGRTLTVNFALSRQSELVIALEDDPDVHHLGNDRFEGRINSQFQKKTEGRTYRASFRVSRDQLPPNFTRAEVVLMVKGVQCPHQVRINNRLITKRLADAPGDGSFGEYRAAFDAGWLLEGENQFKIRARSCGGDLDDFEFVNVRIRLRP
ncbi:MAG TPA: hypothetical protein P5081_04380 [Phycisphaerae bacterium]|nr:hypothetical protein [Phycisphaerae bacterium]HRW52098.1 hypothetical protein [Phycisphaerae bacterium]